MDVLRGRTTPVSYDALPLIDPSTSLLQTTPQMGSDSIDFNFAARLGISFLDDRKYLIFSLDERSAGIVIDSTNDPGEVSGLGFWVLRLKVAGLAFMV